ncbi:hypothetical protein K438DRAFT_1982100 [Mycena galopus ATCC 62051]|nr:hypothetical protein K438DRAFT_1982100 [Mycena galopus ATCC 62051]
MLARLRHRLPRRPARALHASATARTTSYIPGGSAGLSAAIHLKQLQAGTGNEVLVVVLEKAGEIGAHISLARSSSPLPWTRSSRMAYNVSRPPASPAGDELEDA